MIVFLNVKQVVQRNFLFNIIIIVFANLLVKPIWIFLIDRNVQLHFGNQTYGTYAALFNLSLVFSNLLDLGLSNYNNIEVAESPTIIKTYFRNMLITKVFLFVIYALVIISLAALMGYKAAVYPLLAGLIVTQFLSSLLAYLRSNIAGLQQFRFDAVLGVADKLLMILACGACLYLPQLKAQFTITQFVLLQCLCYVLVIALCFFQLKKYALNNASFNWPAVKEILVKSLPYALLIFLMAIYLRVDLLILERFANNGAEQAGKYAFCYRLLDAFNMIGYLFAALLLSMYARHRANRERILNLIEISSHILIIGACSLAALCWFYAKPILLFLKATPDADLILCFKRVMLVFPAMCLMNIYSTYLTANRNIWLLNAIAGIAAFSAIVFNYWAIQHYNYAVIALVDLIIQSCASLAYLFFTYKVLKYFPWKNVLTWLAAALVFILLNYYCAYISINLYLAMVINLVIYIGAALILIIKRKQHLVQYLKA